MADTPAKIYNVEVQLDDGSIVHFHSNSNIVLRRDGKTPIETSFTQIEDSLNKALAKQDDFTAQQEKIVSKKGSETLDYNTIPNEYGLWLGLFATLNKLSDQSGEFVINTPWGDGKTGAQIAVAAHHDIMGYRTKYLDNVWRPWKQLASLSALGATNWDSGNFPVEYGTWTPTLYGGTTAGAFTYSRRFGYYYRKGREVRIWLRLMIDTVTTAPSGRFEISGLPFSLLNNNDLSYANAFTIIESTSINGSYPDVGFIYLSNKIILRKDKLTDYNLTGITAGYALSGSGVYLTN